MWLWLRAPHWARACGQLPIRIRSRTSGCPMRGVDSTTQTLIRSRGHRYTPHYHPIVPLEGLNLPWRRYISGWLLTKITSGIPRLRTAPNENVFVTWRSLCYINLPPSSLPGNLAFFTAYPKHTLTARSCDRSNLAMLLPASSQTSAASVVSGSFGSSGFVHSALSISQ